MSDPNPLGSFEEQVLVCAVRLGDEAYGMAVRREIERLTGREITIGAVYSTLDRLEAKALVESSRAWGERSRRVFRITSAGADALTATRAMRERLWEGLDLRALRPHGAG